MKERIGQKLGQYQLVNSLGKGSFADVYLGEHVHLKSLAAIKVLSTRLGSELQTHFLNEARLLARLTHPHIIRILDFGLEDDIPYLVMEYAEHGTLRQRHPLKSRLPLQLVIEYVQQIADALQYAHEQNLIHRDIKPDNILIGARNNLLLSDFGVALIAQTTQSQHNQSGFAGTITYMAPEQLQGKPRFASDQYALAVLVYEWLCGVRPFQGTASELYMMHQFTPPPPLRNYLPNLSIEVEQVILQALEKDPARRFASIKEFSTNLEQAAQADFSRPATLQAGLSVLTLQSEMADMTGEEHALATEKDDDITAKIKVIPTLAKNDNALAHLEASSSQPDPDTVQSLADLVPLSPAVTAPVHPQHHRRTSGIKILLLVALIILIVTGASFAMIYPTLRASQKHVQVTTSRSTATLTSTFQPASTPSIITSPTSQPAATATPTEIAATATAQPTTKPVVIPTTTPTPIPQPTPTPTPQTIVDNLNDWSHVYSHTSNVDFDQNNSQWMSGDTSLLARYKNTNEEVVWKLNGMTSFQAIVYFWPPQSDSPLSQLMTYTSANGTNWTAATPAVSGGSGNWIVYKYTLSNLANVNFVKMRWLETASNNYWAQQVGQVTLKN